MSWEQFESYGYWTLLVTTFLGVALWESMAARRQLISTTERRWGKHATVLVICTLISAVLFRVGPVFLAYSVADSKYGVLNKPWLPLTAQFILGLLVLDFVKYWMHRLYHSVSFLWKVHSVHHSDPDFDVSTAARVHPIESLLTEGANLAAIVVFAVPVPAVVISELFSTFQSLFGHANALLPVWIEKPLRTLFVTPDMHRIHHSEEIREQSRNFSDSFSWWDRLFGTYLPEPAAGQEAMTVGLKGYQNDASLDVTFMLTLPFVAAKDEPTAPMPNGAALELDQTR